MMCPYRVFIRYSRAQRAAIENALEQTGGNVAQSAVLLGRNKHALYLLMGKLGMSILRRTVRR